MYCVQSHLMWTFEDTDMRRPEIRFLLRFRFITRSNPIRTKPNLQVISHEELWFVCNFFLNSVLSHESFVIKSAFFILGWLILLHYTVPYWLGSKQRSCTRSEPKELQRNCFYVQLSLDNCLITSSFCMEEVKNQSSTSELFQYADNKLRQTETTHSSFHSIALQEVNAIKTKLWITLS